jgi:hypothetical protein
MKHFVLLLLFALITQNSYSGGHRKLTEEARISLITCESGNELYSIFGHSAIRVFDHSQHINEVYNYGTFDFNTPNFYLKFANGKLDYMLSAYNFKYFLPSYFRDKRAVSEQVLDLALDEKQKLYEALEENRKPKNKFYRYDFFFDNCATRIRDIVLSSVDGEIIYTKKDTVDMTFRDMLHLYLDKQPWTRDGIDLILGSKIDRKVTVWESMFLPDYLKDYFVNVNIKTGNEIRPLVESDITLLEFDKSNVKRSKLTPGFVTWTLFIFLLFLTIIEKRVLKKRVVPVDRLLLLVTGILGFIIFYLWFLTEHSATGNNLNILWAMPTNIILAFFLKKVSKVKFFKVLAYITLLLLLFVLLTWKLLPQELVPSAFPIGLIMLIRLKSYLPEKKV